MSGSEFARAPRRPMRPPGRPDGRGSCASLPALPPGRGRPGRPKTPVRLACLAALLLLTAGCRVTVPQADAAYGPPPRGNAELMEYIGAQSFVPAEAGYRAAYMLRHGDSFAGDFEGLRQTLADENLIPRRWSHAPDEALTRAAAGTLIYRACQVRSGLNAELTGLGRYAWRELHYRGIAEPGSEYKLVSGGEFLGILLRADDYLRRKPAADSGPSLGDRPG